MDMPGIFPDDFETNAKSAEGPGPCPINDPAEIGDESYPHRPTEGPGALARPARLGRRTGQGVRADRAFRKGAWDMMAWVGVRLWLAVWTVIRTVKMAHHEQVYAWECVLITSGAAPLTAAGPLRWVPSLGGDRLVGSRLPTQDPSETRR